MERSYSAPSVLSLKDATRAQIAVRRLKVGAFQALRLARWAIEREDWQRPSMAPSRHGFGHCVYHATIPLTRRDPGADPVLDRGKCINVALAAPHFHGLVLTPDEPLSFWRALGRCTKERGFRLGMEIRGGCIVPTLGGGLCILSNALFRVACELGWRIIERHGHTAEAAPPLPGQPVWGLDATVFWPHVDLRVAPRLGASRLDVTVVRDVLTIRVDADRPATMTASLLGMDDRIETYRGVRIRQNRVIRSVVDTATGAEVSREVVAINHRRLLYSTEQRRSCLTCAEESCHARPRDLPRAT